MGSSTKIERSRWASEMRDIRPCRHEGYEGHGIAGHYQCENNLRRGRGTNEVNRVGVRRLSTSVTGEIGANTFSCGSASAMRSLLSSASKQAAHTPLRANRRSPLAVFCPTSFTNSHDEAGLTRYIWNFSVIFYGIIPSNPVVSLAIVR